MGTRPRSDVVEHAGEVILILTPEMGWAGLKIIQN